ncbi:MAG: hypothetical protein Fur0037_22490 [Planctomycetota bacterium]
MQWPALTATTLLAALAACAGDPLSWQGGPGSSGLRVYKRSFAEALGDEFASFATLEQIVAETRSARVLWLGDDHKDVALHELQRGLLERLAAERITPMLLLEAIGEEDQPDVDAFLDGRITLPELRARCRARWPGTWLCSGEVDASHYGALLELAKERGWRVRAVEPTPRLPLPLRDARIASAVRDAVKTRGPALPVAIVGQAHLLGEGDLVHRVNGPSLVLGARPPLPLRKLPAGVRRLAPFARTGSGVLFFTELLAADR